MTTREKLSLVREYWPLIVVGAGALSSMLTVLAIGLWSIFGAGITAEAKERLGISQIEADIGELRRDVAIARAPAEIVSYGPASGFRDPCPRGEVCYLLLEIKRSSPAAEKCQIIPDGSRREVTSVATGRVWEVEVEGGTTRNVPGSFVMNEVAIRIPATIPPGDYRYQQVTYYTGCPWQTGGEPPVSSVSPLIPFIVE